MAAASPACPVCSARFRGATTCSRCGTDLTPLMRLVARAHTLRKQAGQAVRAGDLDGALRLSAAAGQLFRPDA